MRIAMLAWESMHSVAIGGLAPHVTELSAALQRRGHDVHVFTRIAEGQSGYDCIDGVHYHRCPYSPSPDFLRDIYQMNQSFVWHLGETEYFLGSSFDIIHGHDWLSVDSIRQVKNEWRRPVVMTMHSTEYGRCGNSVWDDVLSHRIRDLEWEGTYLASRVICVSKTLGEEVRRLYEVPVDKVSCVYNGVDARKYEAKVDTNAVRKHFSISGNDSMVLFAGRLTWQKGPDLLLDAVPSVLKENRRAKFVFAGDGDMRAGLESRATTTGIASSTRFLGHRTGRDLVGIFKGADMVCVPSRNEPFGIVILEAWSAEKPVVTTRIGGPAEFVRDHHNGITVGSASDDIGTGLTTMLSDRDAARTMGRNGRKEAVSKFSWDNSAIETEKAYELVLSAPRPSSDSPTTNGGTPAPLSEDQIRRRAHAIYLARRGAPGDPQADWLEAKQQLQAEYARQIANGSTQPSKS